MRSRKQTTKINRTLKNRITNYICKTEKRDICCEDDIERTTAINQIFDLYTKLAILFNEENEYLSYLDNDIVKFIGYKIDLEKNKDTKGVKLWEKIDSTIRKGKNISKNKIITVLMSVPLYYLLSFLGYAYYRYTTTNNAINNT
jgi:hypothetical protein